MADITSESEKHVKALKQRTNETLQAGRAEAAFRREINETVRVLKNEKDIMSSIGKVQSTLTNSTQKAGKELENLKGKYELNEKMMNSLKGSLGGTQGAYDKLTKTVKKSGISTAKQAEKLKLYKSRMVLLKTSIKKVAASNTILKGSIDSVETEFNRISAGAAKFEAEMKKLDDILGAQVGTWEDLENATDQYIKKQEEMIDLAEAEGRMKTDEAKILRDELKTTQNLLATREKFKDIAPAVGREKEARTKAEAASKLLKLPKGGGRSGELLAQQMGDYKSKGSGALGTLMKGKGGLFGGIAAARELQESAKHYKALKEKTLGAGKGAKLLGGNIKMLALAFEGLSKGNIFLLIAGMIGKLAVAAFNGVKDLDKWLKEYNKSFMEVYGSTTLMKDVRGSMRSFTDAVFDMDRNLALGLNSEEIIGLFKALNQVGMTAPAVAGKFGTYNKAIRESVKLSRDFGVSLSEMGGMLGDQMMELRSSISEVKDSFAAMSYDASRAGIQSQKFYQAVYAASSSLGMYGNYLDDASGKLKKYLKTGAMGFEDASKQAAAMTSKFSGMSTEQAAALVSMTGGVDVYRKKFEAELETRKKFVERTLPSELKALEEQRDAGAMTEEEFKGAREKIEERFRKSQGEILQIQKVIADKTGMAMYNNMEYLGTQFESVFGGMLQGLMQQGYDIFAAEGPALEKIAEVVGVSSEEIKRARKDILTQVSGFVSVLENPKIAEGLKGMTDDFKSNLIIGMKSLKKTGDWSSFEKQWGTDLEKMGFSTTQFQLLMEQTPDFLEKLVADGRSAFVDGAELNEAERNKLLMSTLKDYGKADTRLKAKTSPDSDRLNQIIEATTSLEDYIGIGKENLKYVAAGNALTEKASIAAIETAKNVFGIANLLTKWARKEKVIESEPAWKAFKESGTGMKAKEQLAAIDYLSDRLVELDRKGKGDSAEAEGVKAQITQLEESTKKIFEDAKVEERMPEMRMDVSQERIGTRTKLAVEKEKLQGLREGLPELTGLDLVNANQQIEESKKKIEELAKSLKPVLSYEGGKLTVQSATNEKINYKNDMAYTKLMRGLSDKQAEDIISKMPPISDVDKAVSTPLVVDPGRVSLAGEEAAMKGWSTPEFSTQAATDAMSNLAFKMISTSGGTPGASTYSAPITLNIESMNGDVEELMKKLQPAIEQSYRRMVYDSGKR